MENGNFGQSYEKYRKCFCPQVKLLLLSISIYVVDVIHFPYRKENNHQVSHKKHNEGTQVPEDLKI
jgi:hypothetical protein